MMELSENQRRMIVYGSPSAEDALNGNTMFIDEKIIEYTAAAEESLTARYPGHEFLFSEVHGTGNWIVPDFNTCLFKVEDRTAGITASVKVSKQDEHYWIGETFYCVLHEAELNDYIAFLLERGGVQGAVPCLRFASFIHDIIEPNASVRDCLLAEYIGARGCIYIPWKCGATPEQLTEALAGCGLRGLMPVYLLIKAPTDQPDADWYRKYPENMNGRIDLLLQ